MANKQDLREGMDFLDPAKEVCSSGLALSLTVGSQEKAMSGKNRSVRLELDGQSVEFAIPFLTPNRTCCT